MNFPLLVTRGNVTIKIYRTRHRKMKSGELYQVAWTGPDGRKIKQFAKLEEAKAHAAMVASRIQAGRNDLNEINRNDLDLLAEVRRLAGDVSPVLALEEWARARKTAGEHLIEAVEYWANRKVETENLVGLKDALEQFLQAKQSMKIDIKTTYKNRLHLFVDAFKNMRVSDVTTRDINRYLQNFDHPVTRNTHRKNIITFFRWCKKQGFLAHGTPNPAENTDRAQEEDTEIKVFSPEEFGKILHLIASDHPHYLPALVLAGFCGLRRNEIHAQKWEDIHLDQAILSVSKAKPRTPKDRIVPISKAALEWFRRCKRPTEGPVCPNLAMDRIRDISRSHGIETPENGFRHSFITYSVALNPTGIVAQWAGNTERIIHQHYRKPTPKKTGENWFALSPKTVLTKKIA